MFEDGTWTMPAWAVKRWTRQMKTLYAQLSDTEQENDRQEADKFLKVFDDYYGRGVTYTSDTTDGEVLWITDEKQ